MKFKARLTTIIIMAAFLCLSLVGVAQATVVKKCYIDGNDWAQQTGPRALKYNFHRLIVAAEGAPWYRYNGLRGALDEFAIYDKVLPDPCIVAHANAVTPEDYNSLVAADGPILWLKFEDPCSANDLTAADSSGNGLNGTYIGDGPGGQIGDVNLVPGFLGNAAEFYGTSGGNGTCIDIVDANGALELQDLTVEFWVKSTTLFGGYQKFFSHNGGADVNSYAVGLNNDSNNPTVGLIGGGAAQYDPVDADMNDGQWHHIVFTFDSTPDFDINEPTERYEIEVKKDHPVLYLRFESDTPKDDSNNNYWVDWSNAVTIETVPGSYGSCAHLNGGWIAAANTTYEPCLPTDYDHSYAFSPNDLSVEFWLYTPEPDTIGDFVHLFTQSEDETYWAPVATRAATKCRMAFGDNRTPNGGGFAYTRDGEVAWLNTDQNWHHYVVIWDETPTGMRVMWYSDSVNYKDQTYAAPSVSLGYIGPEMDHILIGRAGSRDAPAGNPYPAYIDEFAIYPYVLTLERINAHRGAFYAKNCQEMWDRDLVKVQAPWAINVDRNRNCVIDFIDFASFALDWALCNDPNSTTGGTGCSPNW